MELTCTKCGAKSHGAREGQKHRKCPQRKWKTKPGVESVRAKPVVGSALVEIVTHGTKGGGGTWEAPNAE